MIFNKRKCFFVNLFLIFAISGTFAMPCFESFIPDSSGEYVYYEDYTFNRKSYVGILYYDNSFLQARYYAPADSENRLPAKNIELLVSVEPYSEHLEMTGEKFLSTILPEAEDTEIVNYLHEILYEFTERRSKAVMISPTAAGYVSDESLSQNGIFINQDFELFGGKVDIQFDALVPLFNIKNIFAADGSKLMECVTFGQLASAEDKSFSEFSGFSDDESVAPKNNKKRGKTQKVQFENQSITLYDDWSAQMENFWSYGNDAIITLSSIPSASDEKFYNENFILRKLLLSSTLSYVNFAKTEIFYKKNQIKIVCPNWQSDSEKSIMNTKILTAPKKATEESPAFYCLILSVYTNAYAENRSYYDKILKSYQVK